MIDQERHATLVEDYTKSSLYRALHHEVTALIAEANSKEAPDPNAVMRLRGHVEAYQRILSRGFLAHLATHVLLAEEKRQAEVAPANPPMHPADWWITDRPADDLVS